MSAYLSYEFNWHFNLIVLPESTVCHEGKAKMNINCIHHEIMHNRYP